MNKTNAKLIREFLLLKNESVEIYKQLDELERAGETNQGKIEKIIAQGKAIRNKWMNLFKETMDAYPDFNNSLPDSEKLKWFDGFKTLLKLIPNGSISA